MIPLKIIDLELTEVNTIVQAPTGVDIIMMDGSIRHILNANTDGEIVWFD